MIELIEKKSEMHARFMCATRSVKDTNKLEKKYNSVRQELIRLSILKIKQNA
jgi:hypothetical protein